MTPRRAADIEEAIGQYRRLLERQPRLADAHFNLALLYKKNKQYDAAAAAYEEAARLGISDVQEVWSNLGVLYSEMRRGRDAAAMYERALAIDPDYLPALFNRAGLFEETGKRQEAIRLYRRILTIDSDHPGALARLVHANRMTSADDPLLPALRAAIERAEDDLAREELLLALGKGLDDLGQYEEAFAAYRAGNDLGKRRNPPYGRRAMAEGFGALARLYSADWIEAKASGIEASPIFICGMFRSGSTLVEQILAAHPEVTPGGELDLLPWLASQRLPSSPEGIAALSRQEVESVANDYLERVQALVPDAANVTDKRPDNFLRVGLIKALFPKARIVYTKRHPLDTCLSIYFQQLGGNLSYATDLADSAHYYRLHEKLMAHWQRVLGDDLCTVDYDELVRAPEPVLRRLITHLGLEWDDRCLDFQHTENLVKTASVWQVREPLHARASGRWRHYDAFLAEARERLDSPQ